MASIKTREQIDKMKRTGRLVHRVISETSAQVKPGVTTGELEDFAVRLIAEAGGSSPCVGYTPPGHPPYPAWTCISVNEEIVHAIPGRRKLQEGDIVTIDCGVELNGWIADSAWTYGVGNVSPQAERLLK